LGAFGRVAGQIANDWASQRQTNQQTSEELANNAASRAEIAQRIKSQMLSDQLAQAAQSATERNNDLKNQVLQQNLKTAGWDTDRGQYEQDDHGNWLFTIRNPYTKETRSFPSGKPSAVVEKEDTDAAAMERRKQQDADTAARQKETELAKQLAAKARFQSDMALLNARENAMNQRAARLADTKGMDAQMRFKFMQDPRRQDAFNDMQLKKQELANIDKQLTAGKNPTARTGLLGTFDSKEMSDDQRQSLVDQKKQLYEQIEQDMRQMEMIRALYDMPVPSPNQGITAPPGALGSGGPAGGGPPPLPGGFRPVAP